MLCSHCFSLVCSDYSNTFTTTRKYIFAYWHLLEKTEKGHKHHSWFCYFFVINWHWRWLTLVTVYDFGHDCLVLCPLLVIFTLVLTFFCIAYFHLKPNQYLSPLLPRNLWFIPSYTSSLTFSISFYTCLCNPAFCSFLCFYW